MIKSSLFNEESLDFDIVILRLPAIRVEPAELRSVLDELKTTAYVRRSPLEEAPYKTDCVTSIHYIFRKAFNYSLPVDLIGDMPRLLHRSDWELKIMDCKDLQVGDLVFLKRKREKKLVAHVGLVVESGFIFHCKRGEGAVIDSIETIWEDFEQKLRQDLLKYIDPRNTPLRQRYGTYIT